MRNPSEVGELKTQLRNLLALALSEDSTEALAVETAANFIKLARENDISVDQLMRVRIQKQEVLVYQNTPPPPPGEPWMPFGKYKGAALEEVFAKDPAYCTWLLSETDLPEHVREFFVQKFKEQPLPVAEISHQVQIDAPAIIVSRPTIYLMIDGVTYRVHRARLALRGKNKGELHVMTQSGEAPHYTWEPTAEGPARDIMTEAFRFFELRVVTVEPDADPQADS